MFSFKFQIYSPNLTFQIVLHKLCSERITSHCKNRCGVCVLLCCSLCCYFFINIQVSDAPSKTLIGCIVSRKVSKNPKIHLYSRLLFRCWLSVWWQI